METIRKFIPYYKPYKGLFFLDLLCAAVVSLVDVAFPQILNLLTKYVFTGQSAERILFAVGWVTLGMLAMYLLRLVCEYFICTWGHIVGAKIEGDMRSKLFDKMQSLPFSYYDKHNSGDLMARVISDLFEISEVAHHGPENVLLSVCKIIGALIILLTINIPLTMVLFALVIIMALFSLFLNYGMKRIFKENREKISQVNMQLLDTLAGIRVVKAFANEALEREKFHKSNEAFLESKKRSFRILGKFQSGNSFLQGMLFVAVIGLGGIFIATGQITVTDLALYALYINVFINPVNILINFMELFQKGIAAFSRYLEIIETDSEIKDAPNAVDLSLEKGEIIYDNVAFSYTDQEPVLKNFSMKIPAGKTVALVGPSGSGKTTICSLLPRFYDVSGGKITIDETDIRDVTQQSLHNAIGIVQQDVYLFSGTIRENIAYGRLDASFEEIVEAAKSANIHEFIMGLPNGYDTQVGERGVRFSGGQKQRISIARVFLKNPRILILDEATSALDNENEHRIQEALDKLSKNRTTIVIAHRLSTIQNADCIYVIAHGKILEQGSHAELLAQNGVYARSYQRQFAKDRSDVEVSFVGE